MGKNIIYKASLRSKKNLRTKLESSIDWIAKTKMELANKLLLQRNITVARFSKLL